MSAGVKRASGPVRTIKHFSLHRIGRTELRIVADVDTGVLSFIQAEEAVVRSYAQQEGWPHRWVNLFVLQDLLPLLRQPQLNLPPDTALALEQRPVVNVYDLANPAGCQVFVNQQAMEREGYWGDMPAMRGLLAHEHAHPLAENGTVQASRRLRLDLAFQHSREQADIGWLTDVQDRVQRQFLSLANEVCRDAPREIFANEVAIRSGFGEDLFYLDRRNVTHAGHSVTGREELRRLLRKEMDQEHLSLSAADLLLLIGDMKGYLNLALETAAFCRAGQENKARELDDILSRAVFPYLEPQVPLAYAALREQYIALRAALTPLELAGWGQKVLNILIQALAEKGQGVRGQVQIAE